MVLMSVSLVWKLGLNSQKANSPRSKEKTPAGKPAGVLLFGGGWLKY